MIIDVHVKSVAFSRYVFQTLIMVIPLTLLVGFAAGYILDLEKNQFVLCLIIFVSTGIVLGLAASFNNYNRFVKPLNLLGQLADSLYNNNLSYEMDDSKAGGQKEIIQGLNLSVSKLNSLLSRIKSIGELVRTSSHQMISVSTDTSRAAEQISLAVASLAEGASAQAASTKVAHNNINSIMDLVSNVVKDIDKSHEVTKIAKNKIDTGAESVMDQNEKMRESSHALMETVKVIESLATQSKEIGEIISVIRGIADQTGLLSLNAAIEAARAGEQGRGFAVVAAEVNKLAEQSSISVNKIQEIINEVRTNIEQAVVIMKKVDGIRDEQEKAFAVIIKVFTDISDAVVSIDNSMQNMTLTIKELDHNANRVVQIIDDIASVSQEAASGTQQIAASTEEQTASMRRVTQYSNDVAKMADELQESIKMFNL